MKKIAIYSSETFGNIGHSYIYTKKLIENLRDSYDITLYTTKPTNKFESFDGVTIKFCNAFKIGSLDKMRFNKYGFFSNIIYGFYRIYYSYVLLRSFFSENKGSDIFHILDFEYFSLFILFVLHAKTLRRAILTFHSSDFQYIKGRPLSVNLYKSTLKLLLPSIIRNSLAATTHGEMLKQELIKNLNIKQPYQKKIIAVPYGCDNGYNIKLDKEACRKELGISNDDVCGLFFGILRHDKGIEKLLKNINLLPGNVKLVIAGSEGDVTKKKVEEIISRCNIHERVILDVKYLTEREIALYYSMCDFVFIPHSEHHIAFSGPLAIAVEFEKPVVASNVAEISHFVNKFSIGVTFDSANYSDFTTAVETVIDKNNYNTLIKNCRTCMQQNTWGKMAQGISILYNT